MDQYLTCRGSSALSIFRKNDLAIRLGVIEVRALYIHYVALKSSGQGRQADYDETVLHQLLTYGDDILGDELERGEGSGYVLCIPEIRDNLAVVQQIYLVKNLSSS